MGKIKVGDKIYIYDRPYSQKGYIDERTVTKVGREYFYCNRGRRYSMETMLSSNANGYGCGQQVYLSMQQIEDENQQLLLYREITQKLLTSRTPLDKLRQIKEILTTIKNQVYGD
jgi:hypothetical protein